MFPQAYTASLWALNFTRYVTICKSETTFDKQRHYFCPVCGFVTFKDNISFKIG